MNSARFDQILRQVLIVPVLVLLLGAGALVLQMHEAARTVAAIQQTDAALARTLLVERLIVDQESGLRGFQTTGSPVFLEPYTEAVPQAEADLAQLAHSFPLGSPEARLVDQIHTTHDAWDGGFAIPLIATIRAGGKTDDDDLNLQGKVPMDAMRHDMAALTHAEERSRIAAIDTWHAQTRHMVSALIALALIVGLILGIYMRTLLRDVSEVFKRSSAVLRIRAEEASRSEQRLRTTLASIGDGVITCTPEGRIDSMNQVAQQLTGWTELQARNRPLETVFNIVSELTHEPVENPVSKVKRLNRVVSLAKQTLLLRKDGSELQIDDSGAPIRDTHGTLIGIVLVFRDVTLARKSQEALLANEKLAVAGRLAATIAHEIHNPLDSVSNLLFLMDGPSSPEESQHFLQLAKQEIARVTQISRAMLSLYRESRAPIAIDLKELLESVLLLLDGRFTSLGVHVTRELPADLVIQGFPAELRQVFTNLLTNAAEAATPSGTVHLCAEPAASHLSQNGTRRESGVVITIDDEGPGIPDTVLAKLFQPFYTTKGEQGTGLGLWVSRGIISKHGGSIDLESSTRPEDHGTTVTVFLANEPTLNPGGE